MSLLKQTGTEGEIEVAQLISCPNCHGPFLHLRPNHPLYDLQCSNCVFRFQVKSSLSAPRNKLVIRGSGWKVMKHALDLGLSIPPMLIYFKWNDKQLVERREIRFYPFIFQENLKQRIADIKSHNRRYEMFNFDMTGLLYYVLYKQ